MQEITPDAAKIPLSAGPRRPAGVGRRYTIVGLDDILQAHNRIRSDLRPTPVVPWADGDLQLKCEGLQLGGSFKWRGVMNFVRRTLQESQPRGFITGSSGNHGLALALAGRHLGLATTVVVPEDVAPHKEQAILAAGAQVLRVGHSSEERLAHARALAGEEGLTLVPPFDHEWIIAGQGTIGLEILKEAKDVRTVYVPVGGGGLLSGTALCLKTLDRTVRVIGVEPALAASSGASRAAGQPTTIDSNRSVADGLRSTRPGDLNFAMIEQYVDELQTVAEAEILDATRALVLETGLLVEPSGAVGLAAWKRRPEPRALAILSGRNIAPSLLTALLQSAG